jgi:hypothetical protein
MKKGWIAWELPETERARLLAVFGTEYPDVVAHHITHAFGVSDTAELPTETSGTIIGIADDGEGVQALVVDMGHERPDGGTYHITWSLDKAAGRTPKQSNDVIRDKGFEKVYPIPVKGLVAKFYPFGGG